MEQYGSEPRRASVPCRRRGGEPILPMTDYPPRMSTASCRIQRESCGLERPKASPTSLMGGCMYPAEYLRLCKHQYSELQKTKTVGSGSRPQIMFCASRATNC